MITPSAVIYAFTALGIMAGVQFVDFMIFWAVFGVVGLAIALVWRALFGYI